MKRIYMWVMMLLVSVVAFATDLQTIRGAYVYAEPSASASIVCELDKGVKVKLLEDQGEWKLVSYDKKKQGWVKSSCLTELVEWKPVKVRTGDSPKHFGVKARKDKTQDNFLQLTTTAGTEAIVKLMKMNGSNFSETDTCYRVVYVGSSDSYKMKNIPQGSYYLKVAYGRNYCKASIDGKETFCFTAYPIFEMMPTVFDFKMTTVYDETDKSVIAGYQFPTYNIALQLNVTEEQAVETAGGALSAIKANTMNSVSISEVDFLR